MTTSYPSALYQYVCGGPTPSPPARPLLHHPAVGVLQHITSPLSASLLIFSIHKAWQMPAMAASLRSSRLLWREGRVRLLPSVAGVAAAAAAAAVTAAALGSAARPPPFPPAQPSPLEALYGERDAPRVSRLLSTAPSVLWCRRTLQAAHDASGAPWWATITGATLALRCALSPSMLHSCATPCA